MKHALVGMLSVLALGLAGCAASGGRTATVQTGNQTITLNGCKPDLVTVWDHNTTIKTDGHLVTVDENYLTVDGQFIRRPAFKTLALQCTPGTFSVKVDGRSFADLLKAQGKP